MKLKYLLFSGTLLSVFLFGTGFISLDTTSSFEVPELQTKTAAEFILSTEAEEEVTSETVSSEAETEGIIIETEAVTETKAVAETEAISETETITETESISETESESETVQSTETEPVTEAASPVEAETSVSAAEDIEEWLFDTDSPDEVTSEEITSEETISEEEVISEETVSEENISVPVPAIEQQLLSPNKWSRSEKKIKKVKNLVIHYFGNPGTTAMENRDYYESLSDTESTYMSSNYIVGLDGEILQCIPDDEQAYCTSGVNDSSLSIESCHPDSSGKYNAATYISMVKLTAYLSEKYGLDRNDILRHYDIAGRECPRYFCEHSDVWECFLDDVMLYRSLCSSNAQVADKELEAIMTGLTYTYTAQEPLAKESSSSTDSSDKENDTSFDYYGDQNLNDYDYTYEDTSVEEDNTYIADASADDYYTADASADDYYTADTYTDDTYTADTYTADVYTTVAYEDDSYAVDVYADVYDYGIALTSDYESDSSYDADPSDYWLYDEASSSDYE